MGDKEYDQGHVVKVLCKVISGLGAMKAVAAFQEAQVCAHIHTHTYTHRHTYIAPLSFPLPMTHSLFRSFIKTHTHTHTHTHTQTKGKAIVLICDEESAETVAELICRNKPPVIADVEPLRKGD